jgi:hypothetical protein
MESQRWDSRLHSWNNPSTQSASESQTLAEEEGKETKARQGVLDEPISPRWPLTHSPHVPSIEEHSIRFNATQSGAREQFTRFNTVEVTERVFVKSSGSLFTREMLTPVDKNTVSSSVDILVTSSSTITPDTVREMESNWSNTTTTQVRLEVEFWGVGRTLEAYDSCNFDLNTVRAEEEEDDERNPNWYDNGRSSSTQSEDDIENTVSNILPLDGLTSNTPPKGGEFVVMTTLVDEEWPLAKVQLRVNTKDDCWGRLFPTITQLRTWGVLVGGEGRVRERGDREIEERRRESSFTDHCTSPLDPMSTLPKIFSFDEGLIFDPDNTSRLTTGDREARMEIWMAFSQLLASPGDVPLITIWNTAPTVVAKEEFTEIVNTEKLEVLGVKTRAGHAST